MTTLRVALALILAFLAIPWFTAPVIAALVTLPTPMLWPSVPSSNLGEAENVTEQNCSLTLLTDYCAFVWHNPSAFTVDSVDLMVGAITTWPTSGIQVSIQTVSTAAAPAGLLGGSSAVTVVGSPTANTWNNFGAGMNAVLAPGVWYALKIALANVLDASVNVNFVVVGGTAAVGPRHSMLVTKNGTRQSSTWPRMGLLSSGGAYHLIHALRAYPGDTANVPADFVGRPDTFFKSGNSPVTGPNVITQTVGTTLSSTAHGLASVSPYQRVQLFDSAQAGAMRVATRRTTPADGADAATMAEGFPVDIAAASSVAWRKIDFAQHGCVKFQMPFTARAIGTWVSIFPSTASTTYTFSLYNTDSWTVLASVANTVVAAAAVGAPSYLYFTSTQLLASRKTYYLCLQSNSTGTATVGIPVASAQSVPRFKTFMNTTTWQYAERYSAAGANSIASLTNGVIVLNTGALTLLNRVIYNSTNPTYSDWVEFTSGANSGIFCQLTALTDQGSPTGFTVGNCTAALTNFSGATVSWNRWSSLEPAYTTLWPSMGLIIDQLAVGDDTGWLN